MKNFRKSLKELVQVNPEAGYLRLFFSAVLIFVLWSSLAIISVSFNPLGNLDLNRVLDFSSSNLALSLFRDILKAYFSLFTITSLILLLSVFYISFFSIAYFYTRLKSYSSMKISKNYLSNCAFSFPQTHKYLFPDDLINSLNDIPDGPFKAIVKPGYALFVISKENYSIKFNKGDNSENLEVSLTHKEKSIDCFNIKPASISFITKGISYSKSFLIELAYSFEFPANNESTNQYLKMFELCDSSRMREMVEKVLISEVKGSINQYLRNTAGFLSFSNNQAQEKTISNKMKLVGKFDQKRNHIHINSFNKFKNQEIKRNRKRPIYLSPAFSVDADSGIKDENFSPSLIDLINESFTINLQNTTLNLFSSNIIRAKILKINEQETI